jgi:hypothetical protein
MLPSSYGRCRRVSVGIFPRLQPVPGGDTQSTGLRPGNPEQGNPETVDISRCVRVLGAQPDVVELPENATSTPREQR